MLIYNSIVSKNIMLSYFRFYYRFAFLLGIMYKNMEIYSYIDHNHDTSKIQVEPGIQKAFPTLSSPSAFLSSEILRVNEADARALVGGSMPRGLQCRLHDRGHQQGLLMGSTTFKMY